MPGAGAVDGGGCNACPPAASAPRFPGSSWVAVRDSGGSASPQRLRDWHEGRPGPVARDNGRALAVSARPPVPAAYVSLVLAGLVCGCVHVGWGPAGRDASSFVDRLSAIYARSVPAQKGMCIIPHDTVQLLCGARMDASTTMGACDRVTHILALAPLSDICYLVGTRHQTSGVRCPCPGWSCKPDAANVRRTQHHRSTHWTCTDASPNCKTGH